MSLREKLKALEELQQVDIELAEVKAEAEAVPRRRAAIEADVAVVRKAWQGEQDRLAGIEREKRSQEQTVASERDKVKKWEGRLAEIRTPREYAALSREIDIARKTNESVGEQTKLLSGAGRGGRPVDRGAPGAARREGGRSPGGAGGPGRARGRVRRAHRGAERPPRRAGHPGRAGASWPATRTSGSVAAASPSPR